MNIEILKSKDNQWYFRCVAKNGKILDNVVDFAVANLGMDEEKLKAWRPES